LCYRTLDIVITILDSLPALALYNEPTDCLDAFKNFIFKLIEGYSYVIDSPEKARTLVRGNARNALQVIDCLFKVHRNGHSDQLLEIGKFLQQLHEHQKNTELSLLVEGSWLKSWALEVPGKEKVRKTNTPEFTPIARDGSYLFLHNKDHGLLKVRSGYHNTVRGHIYLSKPNFRTSNRDGYGYLTVIRDRLYYYAPDLTPTTPVQPSVAPAVVGGEHEI